MCTERGDTLLSPSDDEVGGCHSAIRAERSGAIEHRPVRTSTGVCQRQPKIDPLTATEN
jgi:hypothetical protein